MKLQEILRFELTYQIRRPLTWLCFAGLFVFAFGLMGHSSPSNEAEFLFSPFFVAFGTVLGGIFWLLAAASVAGEAAARDVQTGMHPLMYTAGVRKVDYLGGRFLAAFIVNALLLLTVQAGLFVAQVSPWLEEVGRLGPFRPGAYITAYVFIALPFAFVATAVQFSSAALSRRPMASYLASVLLFFGSIFASLTVTEFFERSDLTGLTDLVGFLGIIHYVGETWTVVEKNTRLVGLEGWLLTNRLIWLSVAVGVLVFTYVRFRLAHPADRTLRYFFRGHRDAKPTMPTETGIARGSSVAVPQVRQMFGTMTFARQAFGIAWDSFRSIARSGGGLVLLVVIPALVVLIVPGNLTAAGTPWLPRTGYVLNSSLTAALTYPFTPWVIIPLLIVLYASGLSWRERDVGVGDLTDAAPVSESALFLGKFLGLGLVLVAWSVLLTLAGVLSQASLGYRDFEIGLYLKVLFGLQLPEYLLFALLALVVQTVIQQKYVGLLVALIAYGYVAFASSLGIEHNLLVYGSGPEWFYSDMRGFGPSVGPWLWFKLYWAAWALLLAVAARLLWVRGQETDFRVRLRAARRRFTRPTARVAAAAVGLILGLGGFIFYNTNVLNEYTTVSQWADRKAEYERRYGRYAGVPQPRLSETRLHVEIYPDQRKAEIRGTYRLVNRSAVAIDSIHVATAPDVETGAVTFDRPAPLLVADEDLDHRIYALESPLQPGEALQLDFTVRFEARGFRNDGVSRSDASVVSNGTFFTNEEWLPAIGYQPGRELNLAGMRRAHGLEPRPFFRSLYDIEARQDSIGEEFTTFDAVVGTDTDQVAVAPGTLRRTWTEDGRRYFRYSTDAPIFNDYAILSAEYAVVEEEWDGVAIRIYHHPGHMRNLDRMLRSVQASLDYLTNQFGPYRYRHITLVERPGLGGAHSYASMITFQEGFSLFVPERDPLGRDVPFSFIAHEVAHQWWGSYLSPWRLEGMPLLAEGLAQYSAYQVMRETYGQEHLGRLILSEKRAEEETLRSRADVPLLRANSDFHEYRKGPWAMYALSEYVGEERVNTALRRLQNEHRSGILVTTLDLYRELQAVTPDSLQYLLDDLFAANTFWELETEGATAEQTQAGTWEVTLDVRARKVVVDEAGVETEVPMMSDWIEIGVYALRQEGQNRPHPLYLQKHRIRSGRQTITVTVSREPGRAGIDPKNLLIDLKRSDNLMNFNQSSDVPLDLI